jgi:hypothetical protein
MKRMIGLILAIAGVVVVALCAYSVMVTHRPVFGFDAAYMGAAALAALTLGIIAVQK